MNKSSWFPGHTISFVLVLAIVAFLGGIQVKSFPPAKETPAPTPVQQPATITVTGTILIVREPNWGNDPWTAVRADDGRVVRIWGVWGTKGDYGTFTAKPVDL